MSLIKYQILLKTVELGGITKAAEALGYTQSAASRMIAALEQEWDIELLVRGRGGVRLSPAGETLLPYLRSVCTAHKELEEQVADLHGLTRGTLRVGTFTSVSIHWLPSIMKEFLQRYPGIHFELVSSWEFAEIEDAHTATDVNANYIGNNLVTEVACEPYDATGTGVYVRHDAYLLFGKYVNRKQFLYLFQGILLDVVREYLHVITFYCLHIVLLLLFTPQS